ncbi:MAG: hypothetical protein RhofKO_10720 [Rhodothermales bacterium]
MINNAMPNACSMRFGLLAILLCCLGIRGVQAQDRAEITINDTEVRPENLTSSEDGTVYFGSMAKGTIYRAMPGAAQAEPWILADEAGLTNVLGVLADDASGTLWVCQNATRARGDTPSTGQTALRAFDLESGADKGTYPFPAESGICNDIAVSADGAAYVSESFRGRIHRLLPGASELEEWLSDETISVIDGLAFLADGALYVNDFTSGKLFRIPVEADGSAGALVELDTSLPLVRPDGLRSVGPQTLLQTEQQGRVAELVISGDRAEVRVLNDELPRASGVTLAGDTAWVLVDFNKAVAVPYVMGETHGRDAQEVGSQQTAEQALRELSSAKWQWMADKDVAALEPLFHEESRFVHMSGTWGKDRELEIIRSGSIHYKHAEVHDVVVEVMGETAVLWNRITLLAEVRGNEVSNEFTVTEVYQRQADAWSLLALTFSSVRDSHRLEH